MTNFRNLLCILIDAQHKLRILHWNAKGKHFDGAHNICGEYVDKLNEHIDTVAELYIAVSGKNPVSLEECANKIDVSVDAFTLYDGEEVFARLGSILSKIIDAIKFAEKDDIPEYAISKLQEIEYYYVIENYYKNSRRVK